VGGNGVDEMLPGLEKVQTALYSVGEQRGPGPCPFVWVRRYCNPWWVHFCTSSY